MSDHMTEVFQRHFSSSSCCRIISNCHIRLDGNILHEHYIYNFNQSSVSHLGDDMTTFNGTMTVTLREGPIENVTGYIQILGDSIAIWIDPRAVDNHFGPTPIHGIVLPVEAEQG